MDTYKNLPEIQKAQLRKFPAYITLLAASYHNHGMDEKEKQAAIKFTHVKSFKSEPLLTDFYDDVEKDFEQTLTLLNSQLPKPKKEREAAIKAELDKTEAQRREVMAQAHTQGAKFIEEARSAAARLQQEESNKATAAAAQIMAKAHEAAAQDHDRMLAELKREVGRLVVQATAAVTGKILTVEDQRRLSEETSRQIMAER